MLDDIQAWDFTDNDHSVGWEITRAVQEFCREEELPWKTYPGGQGLGEISITHTVRKFERVDHDTVLPFDFERMPWQLPWWKRWMRSGQEFLGLPVSTS